MKRYVLGVLFLLSVASCANPFWLTGQSTSSADSEGSVYTERVTYLFGIPVLRQTEICRIETAAGQPRCEILRGDFP